MADTERSRAASPLGYQPALDGVRAVAVAMVLFFHAGFGWMGGGYFGVSIFFTLSGFLITSLLISEHQHTGRIQFGSFIARRAKRLLPASILCLALVSIARLAGQFDQVVGLRGELLGAATHVFNWVKIGGDSSYTDVFAGSAVYVSPLEHYWSLAIEEQFYLIWPIVIALLAARVRRWAIVLPAAFIAVAVVTPLAARVLSNDVTYWATPMRAGELLAGAALAAVVQRWPVPVWAGRFGAAFAVALLLLAIALPTASGPAYAGLFAPLAAVSAALLWSLQVRGPVRTILSNRLLVGLGQISYGIYLFHWPVFVWLRQQGWSLTELWRFGVAVAATLAIARLSYVLVERPIRTATLPTIPSIGGAVAAMLVAVSTIAVLPFSRGFLEADSEVLAAASAVPVDSLAPLERVATSSTEVAVDDVSEVAVEVAGDVATDVAIDVAIDVAVGAAVTVEVVDLRQLDVPRNDAAASAAASAAVAVAAVAPVADAPSVPLEIDLGEPLERPVRLLTVGDSTAFYIGQALAEWSLDHRAHVTSDLLWCQGCGLLRAGEVTVWDNTAFAARSVEMLDVDVPALVARVHPDVVALMVTVVDVADRQWSEAEGPLEPTDDRYRARLAASYRRVALDLLDLGVGKVAFIKPPRAIGFVGDETTFPANRWEALHDALDEVAADLGPQVISVDLAAWAEQAGVVDDPAWRPDGTHLTASTARDVVERWLGPTLFGAAG